MEYQTVAGTPHDLSTFRVCVDAVEHREPQGKLYSPYAQNSADFSGVVHLVAQGDAFFDKVGFPQAYNTYRSFGAAGQKSTGSQRKELVQYMSKDVFETKLGEKLTFVIQVQFRQNSTWQGIITWVEQNKVQHFRSTLEMIKLMDSALAPQGSSDFASWEGKSDGMADREGE